MVISASTTAMTVIIIAIPTRLRPIVATLISLHATTNGLGRDSLADFNVRLLDYHA
jgi:hypothetical protein